MYNFVNVGGSSLSRLSEFDNQINVVQAESLDHFKKLVDDDYIVVLSGLTNNALADYKEYVDYIEKNKIHIFVDALYESNIMEHHYKKINAPSTLLISNTNITEHKLFDNVIGFPFFYFQTYIFSKRKDDEPLTTKQHFYFQQIKQKKSFVCLNGVSRPSRKFVYNYLRDNNLIDECLFTFHNRGNINDEQYPTVTLDNDISDTGDGVTWDNNFNPLWFLQTNFNLVTESSAQLEMVQDPTALQHYNSCFFPTEKTFKAIANSHPFICIADQNFHKMLPEYFGFELYDEIWDYAFDSIDVYEPRWKAVLDQVAEVSKQGIDYSKIKDKLEYNQQRFFDEGLRELMMNNFLNQIDKCAKGCII